MVTLLPLAVVVPFLAAALLAAVGKLVPRRTADVVALATSVFVALLGWLLLSETQSGRMVYWFGGWVPRQGVALGISFTVDATGAGLTLLAGLLMTATFIFALLYFDSVHALFHVLMLVFLGAMCGFSLTGDLFNLFVFFQLMGAAAFVLCGYKTEEPGPLHGAINFAVTNTIAAFLTVSGIALVYSRTGALNLAQIGRALGTRPPDGLIITAFVLILSGLFIKAAIVPFHFWLADAHAVAPTPVCVIFSGIMVVLGLYGAERVYWTVFNVPMASQEALLRPILVGAGVLTALVAGTMCFVQHHIKRLLAFSTISHMGLVLIGFGLLTTGAQSGLSVYVAGHAFVKAALFMAAGILLHRFGEIDELKLKGKGKIMPVAGGIFLLGGLALASLPPFATFLGEAHMAEAADKLGYSWLAFVRFAAAALTGGAVLRVCGRVFVGWGEGQEEESPHDPKVEEKPETKGGHDHTPATMIVPAVCLLLLGLFLTFLPGVTEWADLAAAQMHDTSGYAARVLDATSLPLPAPEPHGSLLPSILQGLGSAGAAVALAIVALARRRPAGATERGESNKWAPEGLIDGLRQLHSGRIGDYVTWLTVGVTAFGALCAIILR